MNFDAQEMEAQRLEDATYIPADLDLPPNGESMRVERPAREYRTHVLTTDAGHVELPASVVVHHCGRPADQFENKTVFLAPGGACPSCGYRTDPDGLTVQPDPREPGFMKEYPCEPIEETSASVQKKKLDERPIEPFDVTRINPFTGRLVSYRTRKNTPFEEQEEEANPIPVAADDLPCERIEYPCEPVGGEPSASITKRQLDEKPVPPICDCGGAAAGTPHANWCSTRRRD